MARLSGAIGGTLLLLFSAAPALAQSSVGVNMNAATGRSAEDAIAQNQKELLNSEGVGSGSGKGGTAGGLGGFSAFPTGKLRTSEHDGVGPPAPDRYAFTTNEASAFGNLVVAIPGTVLGGQMKLSGFVGNNWLKLDLKSNASAALNPDQFATGRNKSLFAGASVLWAKQNTYALATLVGMWGETRLVDGGVDNNPSIDRYSFDTSGFIGTATAGHVFDLAGPSGPKFDLRGSIGYTDHRGDWFNANDNHKQKYTFSTWTGTGMVTLFSNVVTQNGGLLRPYVSGYVRQEFGYKNHLSVIEPAGTFVSVDSDQAHTYGGLDVGMTYALGSMTVGAAVYTEFSGDERTLGGRLGASWQLGGPKQAANLAPTPLPAAIWRGFYLGANAGFSWSDVDLTNRGPDELFAPVGGSTTVSGRGPIGGAQVGYNWQLGGVVVGLEGSWSLPMLKDEQVGPFPSKNDGDHWSAEISQIYAISGRLGLANGLWMAYVKGGFAMAKVESNLVRPADPSYFTSQSDNWHEGWTVGGGLEYIIARNWTVGVQYDFYRFGSKDVSAVRTGDGVVDNWTVQPESVQSVTARMNFKFN